MPVGFLGETHSCYSDALAMALGPASPDETVLEVLTGSAFGMTVHRDGLAYFAPADWNPELGIDAALAALGWECDRIGGDRDEAIQAMRQATADRPILAGPVEMGLLPHQVGLGRPIGVDHYITILGLSDDLVLLHDPRGHPYTIVPTEPLFTAWQTDTLSYTVKPYSLRANFRRVHETGVDTALRNLLPAALSHLEASDSSAAAERTAELLEGGINTPEYFHFASFMVCAGALRRSAAALLLGGLGYTSIAATLDDQARLIGSMQYPIVSGDTVTAATAMRKLAPTFGQLHADVTAALMSA
jgi:hypothetical protein